MNHRKRDDGSPHRGSTLGPTPLLSRRITTAVNSSPPWSASLAFVTCLSFASGCCDHLEGESEAGAVSSSADGSSSGSEVATTVDVRRPTEPVVIEESDLVGVDGNWIYVLNEHTGLNVIDATEPSAPKRAARLGSMAGIGGELYVRDEALLVLVGDSSLECHALAPKGLDRYPSTGVASVTDPTNEPAVASERCVPGALVSSRLVGDILYVVTSAAPIEPDRGWLYSLDVSSGDVIEVLADLPLQGAGFEIHMTNEAIFVAEEATPSTRVRYIDISPGDGSFTERGRILVSGLLPGRFHMDALGRTLRMVTRRVDVDASALHVLDITNPDRLEPMGSIDELAPEEELFATRFVGDRAYVVTYQPEIIVNEQVLIVGKDPLWVISLEAPSAPRILGELEIPGWSDYVFPRGDRLLAVGRGDAGSQVAASLFDVSDPSAPRELRRLQFGSETASTEASSDFRAVRVLEGDSETLPLVVVPYSDNVETGEGCVPEHHVQLIEMGHETLEPLGNLQQPGRVLRTLPVEEKLYAVTTKAVTAIDVGERDAPRTVGSVGVGIESLPDECVLPPEAPQRVVTMSRGEFGDWNAPGVDDDGPFCGCSVGATPERCSGRLAWGALLGLMALAFGVRILRRP